MSSDKIIKSNNKIMMVECKKRLNRAVHFDTILSLIDSGILEVSEEVKLYFLCCVLHYNTQLRNCYKLLLLLP